jgi:hypothetical protein
MLFPNPKSSATEHLCLQNISLLLLYELQIFYTHIPSKNISTNEPDKLVRNFVL